MKIRELLQTEIWSKDASRKVLFGLIVATVIAVIGWKAWQSYQYNWLSTGERSKARAALQQIENFRKVDSEDYRDLEAGYQPVKKAIAEAESAAVTERDEITVMRLEACDLETTRNRLQSMLRQPPAADVTPEQMEARAKELARLSKLGELTNGKCEALHNALD
jgi:Tfp pilus assembly protein PilE